jgi:hypothetical protein
MKNEKTKETGITTQEYLDTSLAKFNPIQSKIKKLEEDYLPMEIAGVNDIEGYNAVDIARKDVKKYRTTVEGIRKQEVADALKFQKSVNTEAKRITEMLTPIEEHLIAEQRKIQKQKEEIETEKKRLHALKIQQRTKDLIEAGMIFTGVSYIYLEIEVLPIEIESWTDVDFNAKLAEVDSAYNDEQDRLAIIEQQRKEEEEKQQAEQQKEIKRLAEIAKENEKERLRLLKIKEDQDKKNEKERLRLLKIKEDQDKKNEKERLRLLKIKEDQDKEKAELLKLKKEHDDRIKAEKEKIEKAAKIRQTLLEMIGISLELGELIAMTDEDWVKYYGLKKDEYNVYQDKLRVEEEKKEAKIKADAEAEKIRLEKEEADFKAEQLKIEAAKIEAMKPDKEKLRTFAEFISKIKTPDVTSPEAEDVILNVITAKTRMEDYIMKFVNG